jgi:hypothetical protein
MWLGAPHVSRAHCLVEMLVSGVVRVTDTSTNGTSYDRGILRRDEVADSSDTPLVLDFGGGVTVAVCFNGEHEARFVATNGDPRSFSGPPEPTPDSGRAEGRRKRNRTTFLRTPEEVRQITEEFSQRGSFGSLYRRLSPAGRVVLFSAVTGILALTLSVVGVLVLGFR